jgi:hypothetical protein
MSTPPKKPESRHLDYDPTDPESPRLNRQWLSGRPKDELVDIIIELKSRLPKATAQLDADVVSSALGTLTSFKDTKVQKFVRLPTVSARKRDGATDTTWKIVLFSSDPTHKPLGLEIYDDSFIGRAAAGITPDLDLTEYDGEKTGVSRQHALLRPTASSLFLIDLGSTNGTSRNGKKLNAGVGQKLKDKDTITFGTLHFSIRIISGP